MTSKTNTSRRCRKQKKQKNKAENGYIQLRVYPLLFYIMYYMYGIMYIYILRRDGLLFDAAGKDRARCTQAEESEDPGADQKKQMAGKAAVFPSGCGGADGRPGAAGGKQKGQESRKRKSRKRRRRKTQKSRIRKAEKQKSRKSISSRKTGKAGSRKNRKRRNRKKQNGKRRKSRKKKTEKSENQNGGRKSENNPRTGEHDKRCPAAGGVRPTSAAKIRNTKSEIPIKIKSEFINTEKTEKPEKSEITVKSENQNKPINQKITIKSEITDKSEKIRK